MTMRILFTALVASVSVVTSGCAYWTTYNKQIDLRSGSVAMDAKQRVVYSRKKVTSFKLDGEDATETSTVVCAEPSPDALSALAASNAFSISNPTGVSGQTSQGFAETAASIGLRTQSIQLLRDLNYRICEAYANDAVQPGEATALLRRGQSTMMGLIAIEQLTGPVVASQVALSSSFLGGTGNAPSADTTAAKAEVTAKREALLKALAEQDTAQTKSDQDLSKLEDLKEQRGAELDKPEDKRDAAKLKGLEDSIDTAEIAESSSRDALKDKQRRTKDAQDQLSSAEIAVRKLEDGRTSVGAISTAAILAARQQNETTTEKLVEGVTGIVKEVNKSYFRDTCFSILTNLVQQPQLLNDLNRVGQGDTKGLENRVQGLELLKTTLNVCSEFLREDKAQLTASITK